VKRLDLKRLDSGALEARIETPRTFSARMEIQCVVQRFHLWLPSARISDAPDQKS
jgi:hypothetical protein